MKRGKTCARRDGHLGRCESVEARETTNRQRRKRWASDRAYRERHAEVLKRSSDRYNERRRQQYADPDHPYRQQQLDRYYGLTGLTYSRRMLLQRRQKGLTRMRKRAERDE